ncbi:MAG: protein SCO1/2 [Alloalcanivorax sp.]|jgi:protein SCO1/2|nr:SCO family protein [Alcanivorax sp.]
MRITGLLITLFAVLLVGCGESRVDFHGKDITGVMDDLSFTLTDENGDTVNASIVDNKAVVLFFGYTHCPDYCPMTLTLLAQAMNTLSEQEREQLRVLFVSVDPERDTPSLLKEYTAYFGPEVIGLTGTKDQLDDVTKRYRTAYGYGDKDEQGNYEVSHGLAMYGFDKSGKVRLLMRNDQPVEQVAEDLKTLTDL